MVEFSNRNCMKSINFEKYKFTKCVIILSFVWLDCGFRLEVLEHFSKIVDWKIIEISLKVNFSVDILKNRWNWTEISLNVCKNFSETFLKFLWNFAKNKFFNKKSLKLNWNWTPFSCQIFIFMQKHNWFSIFLSKFEMNGIFLTLITTPEKIQTRWTRSKIHSSTQMKKFYWN